MLLNHKETSNRQRIHKVSRKNTDSQRSPFQEIFFSSPLEKTNLQSERIFEFNPQNKAHLRKGLTPRIKARSFDTNPLYSFSIQRKKFIKMFEKNENEQILSSQRTRSTSQSNRCRKSSTKEGLSLNAATETKQPENNTYVYKGHQLKANNRVSLTARRCLSSNTVKRSKSDIKENSDLAREILRTHQQIDEHQSQIYKFDEIKNSSRVFQIEQKGTGIQSIIHVKKPQSPFTPSIGPNFPFNLNYMILQIRNKQNESEQIKQPKVIQLPGHHFQFSNDVKNKNNVLNLRDIWRFQRPAERFQENKNLTVDELDLSSDDGSKNQFRQAIEKTLYRQLVKKETPRLSSADNFPKRKHKKTKKSKFMTVKNFTDSNLFQNILLTNKAKRKESDPVLI